MAKVITISGKARHGKDTTAEIIKEELELKGAKVAIIHYADYLKFVGKQYFGWNGIKDIAGRTLLQWLGTDKIRNKDNDFWVRTVHLLMRVLEDDYDYFIIPDTRFPNEMEFLKTEGWKVVTMLIKRKNFSNGLTESQLNHPSETALDNYCFDYYMEASDIGDIEDNVRYFLEME